MRKKSIVFLPILMILIALFLSGCTTGSVPTEEATTEVFFRKMEEIKATCRSLPLDEVDFCLSVNDARISAYQYYQEKLEPKEAQAQMAAISTEIQFAAKASTKWQFSIPSVPEVVCSVHANETVSCMATDELVAQYNSEMGQIILDDIDGLFDFFDLEANADILVDCGQGLFESDSFSSYGAADKTEFLSESFLANSPAFPLKFVDLCYQSMLDGTSGGSGAGGALFSGLTGFDPYGNVFCGMGGLGGAGTLENVMGTFESILEDLSEGCEDNIEDTIAEGGAGDETTPEPPPPTDPPPDPAPTEPPDAEIVSETGWFETEDEDGTKHRTKYSIYSDGTKKRVMETIKNGKVVQRSTRITKPGVGWRETHVWFTEDGNVDGEYTQAVYEDGSGYSIVAKSNEEGGLDKTLITWDGQGGGTLDEWKTNINGNINWIRRKKTSPQMCLEGGDCGVCNAGMRTFMESLGKCSTPGGGNYACGAYQITGDCCSNFSGDPRVVIPNPQGDYMCSTEPSQSEEEASCEVMCSLASSPDGEDCLSNCLSSSDMRLWDVNLLDLICIYAISDACYQSYSFATTDFGAGDLEDFGVFSLPENIGEHLILPFEGPH